MCNCCHTCNCNCNFINPQWNYCPWCGRKLKDIYTYTGPVISSLTNAVDCGGISVNGTTIPCSQTFTECFNETNE